MASNLDQIYTKRALRLALRGQGFVEPNPMVGCVIVREDLTESDPENQKDIMLENGEFAMVEGEGDSRNEGRLIVGEGWHQKYGDAHAEINALKMAGDLAKGGVMYVTLEPCVHQGKTPPCVDRVIASGVKRVVIAMSDPFPQNNGAGIEKLRAAGI